MSLEQAIHQRWAESPDLVAQLATDRVTTGYGSPASPPYATVIRNDARPLARTNAADRFDEVTLRIDVWHDDHDAGRAIADEVREAFDRSAFTLPDGASTVRARCHGQSVRQHDNGLWQFSIELTARVHRQ